MPGRFWTGTIDGTALKDGADDAGFTLEGAGAFDYGGVVRASAPGLSGIPQDLYVELPVGGHIVVITFLHAPSALLREVVDKIKVRAAAGEAFPCTFADGFQTITANFKEAPGAWYDRGEPDGAYIKDAVLRLESINAV
jgi:hypothetical protein